MYEADSDPVSRIGYMPLDETGRETLVQLIHKSHRTHDWATMIAAMQSLARSSEGRNDLATLRVELFGGDPKDASGVPDYGVKAALGEQIYLWETAMDMAYLHKAPDLFKPTRLAFGNLSADALTKWDFLTVKRYLAYLSTLKVLASSLNDLEIRWEMRAKLREAIYELQRIHELILVVPSLSSCYKTTVREEIEEYLNNLR